MGGEIVFREWILEGISTGVTIFAAAFTALALTVAVLCILAIIAKLGGSNADKGDRAD